MWYINGSSLEGLQNFLRWYAYSAMGHGSAPNFAICDRDRWNLQELGSIRFWEEISFNVVNSSYLPILALAIHWALPQKFLFFLQNGKIMILCWNLRYSLSPQACVLVTYYLIMRLCPISFVNAEDLHEDAVICSTHLHVNKKRLHLESETPNHFHKYHPFKVKVRSNIYRIEKPKETPARINSRAASFLSWTSSNGAKPRLEHGYLVCVRPFWNILWEISRSVYGYLGIDMNWLIGRKSDNHNWII